MSRSVIRFAIPLLTIAAVAGPIFVVSPANATPIPVFTESFEECVEPGGATYSDDLATATGASNPIHVKVWTEPDPAANCPGWDASGQAFYVQWVSGGSFPDGTSAVWLNEGGWGHEVGVMSTEITGLTSGHDYTIALDTWTDDKPSKTSLLVRVTNGVEVTHIELKLKGRQGVQHLTHDFSALGDTITLELEGSTDTDASPVIDNIVITDAGLTSENSSSGSGGSGGSGGSSAESGLASTGFNAVSALLIVAGLIAAGGLALLARRIVRR